MIRLLIVDDESATRNGLQRHVRWKHCGIDEVCAESNPDVALKTCERFRPDVILSDIRMPGMTGIEMCAAARNILPDVQIIFISGYSDKEYLMSAINLSAVRYVEKPVNLEELESALIQAANAVKRQHNASNIAEEEMLLARFQQALTRRDSTRLPVLQEDIRQLASQDPSVGVAKKLYFRFGCLLGGVLFPERTPEDIEQITRESLDSGKTPEDMYAWFASVLFAFTNPSETAVLSAPVARCTELVAQHLSSEALSVQWLADRVYLTSTYLCSLFKRELGLSPSQYILKQRMEEAKRMLGNSHLSASQIAGRLGYSDPKHFAKIFKKTTQQTPTEYRRSHT